MEFRGSTNSTENPGSVNTYCETALALQEMAKEASDVRERDSAGISL
jgi:hypothetical protein